MSVVTEHLQQRHLDFEAMEHPAAYTALQEALSLGVGAGHVAKAVVLDTPRGHAVAVVAGHQRLDLHRCRDGLGCRVSLASEQELGRDFPEFEPGAFPAVPSMMDVPFLVDPEIMRRDQIIISAGDPRHSARVATAQLFEDPRVTVTPIVTHEDDDKPGVMA